MTIPMIGILTWRDGAKFEEPSYLRKLVRAGERLGATVFIFSHQDVDLERRVIKGFSPLPLGRWRTKTYPWPDVVIDRCRKGSEEYKQLRRQKGLFTYANSTYTNKWTATQLFLNDENLRRWIPKTVAYSPNKLAEMTKQFSIVYLKPGNGTGGRGILKIEQTGDGFRLLGRTKTLAKKSSRVKTRSALVKLANHWTRQQKIRNGTFMIQQGLNLSLLPNRVADTRLLIQKDNQGEWQITGLGVRVGPLGSPTSNLGGGGKPLPFDKLMTARFGAAKAAKIREECEALARQVASAIEKYFGPMMEFGLDIGVDIEGNVWLIEVNPKPGREIFLALGDIERYRQSIERPIQYALHLVRSKKDASLSTNDLFLVHHEQNLENNSKDLS